ncbi:DarT ssDNA thymidine ADP-ribosyltransferase family protein [Actinacidiphila guanduensis]|uniref:DarT ssDNA thymidine ADP-ribosyltransferase family protein n=1 Tax=Actinacidiphila guanduensis TaxID=310781 RepID=UPI000B866DBD|nr:DarT ssDNA thymidine ADP-ribosyltransferase family protein [Actinacidiphila guanduensis]
MTGQVNAEVAAALATHPLARLTHFTPSLNLPNIFTDRQLRSAKDLSADVRAHYRATDLQRLDGYPDKVCCSLQYPNGFYFDIARRKPDAINYPDWVCLILDKSVSAVEGTLFCPRNAAAAGGLAVPGVAGLNRCYAPNVRGQGGQIRTRGPRHDPGSPTDVQAEVLVTAPVPMSAIHAIVFPTQAAAMEEYGRLDRFGTLPPDGMQWVISPGMFDKWAIAAAVQTSRYFPETTWSPEASPKATS